MTIINEIAGLQLIWSVDDQGYYWQETFNDWRTSQLFPDLKTALDSLENNKLHWDQSKRGFIPRLPVRQTGTDETANY